MQRADLKAERIRQGNLDVQTRWGIYSRSFLEFASICVIWWECGG